MLLNISKRRGEWVIWLMRSSGETVLGATLRTDNAIIAHGYAANMVRTFKLNVYHFPAFADLTNEAIAAMAVALKG